jgi:hypothetical protein
VVAALASALFLSACATAPSVEVPPGKLRVVHSLTFADGSQLKEKQNEVTLVTRDATTRAAAGAVALGILGLALGGLAIVPVDKDQFRGRTIDDASDRSNLRNTVARPRLMRASRQSQHGSLVAFDNPSPSAAAGHRWFTNPCWVRPSPPTSCALTWMCTRCPNRAGLEPRFASIAVRDLNPPSHWERGRPIRIDRSGPNSTPF